MQSLGIQQIFVCSKQDQTVHTTWVILLQRQIFSQQLFTRLRQRRLRASRPGSLPDIYPPSRTKVVPRKSAQSNTGKSVLVVRTWTHKFETDLFESILSSLGGFVGPSKPVGGRGDTRTSSGSDHDKPESVFSDQGVLRASGNAFRIRITKFSFSLKTLVVGFPSTKRQVGVSNLLHFAESRILLLVCFGTLLLSPARFRSCE